MTPRIDRRAFLSSSLATTAVLAAGSANAAEEKPKLKMAVKYGMIKGDAPIEEKFALIKSLGFVGVEMDSPS
ncbi:MAG: sugar phosphate isomerase/epimerase family protein, partial [Gemmataceae bacterium]